MDLESTSVKPSYDSDEHTHNQNLSDTLGINDKVETRKLTFIKWGEAYKSPAAIQELYCFLQLVGKESPAN